MAGLADLLTVEEAARVIRVGRTKAYAMAREWRATGGRSGLPVIDFGHVLRVPRCQLEAMVGGPLTDLSASTATEAAPDRDGPLAAKPGREQPPKLEPAPAPAVSDNIAVPANAAVPSARRPSRRRARTTDQPTLPFLS